MRKITDCHDWGRLHGRVHTEAIRRLGNVEVATIVGVSDEEARAFGESMGIERTTGRLSTGAR